MEQIGLEAVLKDSGFQQGIKKYQGSVDTANAKTGKFAGAINTATSKVPGLGSALSLLSNPITLAVSGLTALMAITAKSVKETVDYNKEVRETALVTGLSADETSRVIQIADDWGLSLQETRGALSQMTKKGITPSVEELAKLADGYVAATNKAEFGQEAIKKYGRGYQTLIPLLAEGGDKLRENAAAVSDNMIATEESIAASREYEVAVDNLGDSLQGLKYTIGNAVIPVLTDLLKATDNLADKNKAAAVLEDKLKSAYLAGNISRDKYRSLLRELQYSTDGLTVAQNALDDANRLDFESAEALGNSELRLITIFNDLKSVIPEVTEDVKNYDIETLKAAQAADTEKQALSEMEWVISQPLTKAIEDFNVSQGELQTEMGKVQGEIDELNKMEYLTPDQRTELENLKTKQGELQTEYDKNATVHEEATKRIVFDMLVEKLAAEGLLTSGIFEEMAEKWGLVEDAEILVRINADKATNWLRDHPGDVEGMKRIVEGQATVWGLTHQAALRAHDEVSAYRDVVNSLTDKTITIRTIYEESGAPSPPRAAGGPVYAGQSYIVGEAGPEPFIPSVDGMILPNSAISNYSVSTNNARNISLNMGGVNITNGMDMNAFEARLTYTIKRAMQ